MEKMRETEIPGRQLHKQPVQDGHEKKPYKTPNLTRLGNVKELTQFGLVPGSDLSGRS
jgi:hypothetical protein